MRRNLNERQLVLAAGIGVSALLIAGAAVGLVLRSDGGFDAVDPIDTDNTSPVITEGLDVELASAVGQAVTPVSVQASDADGDPLAFSANNLPPGISINVTTGIISGTATAPCVCIGSVVVDDGRGGRATAELLWTVAGASDATAEDALPPLLQVEDDSENGQTTLPNSTRPTTEPASPTATTATTTQPTATTATAGSSGTSGNEDAPGPSASDTTTAVAVTTIATTTMVETTTTTTATEPDPTGPETFQGVRAFDSFFQGQKQFDAWTSGDIAFYAPQGQVPSAAAEQWLEWYVRVDGLYRVVSGRSDFDSAYRRGTPDLGQKKVLAIVETCGAGCGSKQQAEADPGYTDSMVNNPNDFAQHWIFFYEMGRGGSPEPWYGRATWPSNTVIIPHLMAGLAFYELGGEAGLRQGIPGDLLAELERWEAADIEYVDEFSVADQQSSGNYTSHHLMPAMLWRIRMETDLATVGRVTANMATKPQSTSAVQAMCDFRAAVNEATAGRFDERMTGPWGLPDQC